jgi:TATA-binding protein-associated factor Taf7
VVGLGLCHLSTAVYIYLIVYINTDNQTQTPKQKKITFLPSKKNQTFLNTMKGKRKATANPVLTDAAEGSSSNLFETQVREGNVDEEEERIWAYNGENREETEGEEEEEDDDDEEEEEEEEDSKGEQERDNLFDEERTKLDEGFFEIEAIRRKRVRKV